MKNIILVRHAHPHPSSGIFQDIDRHIDDRGMDEVSVISQFLNKQDLKIQKIISSPAIRALETAEYLCKILDIDKENIEVDQRIYENTLEDLLGMIHEINNKYQNVMLVGHNPSFSELAAYLSGDDNLRLPTCGTCKLNCNEEAWNDVSSNDAECEFLKIPDNFS